MEVSNPGILEVFTWPAYDSDLQLSARELTMNLLQHFIHDDSGATAIEYGLIAGLISVVILTVLGSIGSKLNIKFRNISNALN